MKILAALLLFIALASKAQDSKILFTQVEPILQGLSEITGWKIKRKVPADYITKAKLRGYVQERIKESIKPEEMRIQTLLLRMFGLIPEDYDLEKATVELMTEQAAAFYDYNKKRLFITESDSPFLEKRIALVHELAHALADQNFSLKKFSEKGAANDDAATAHEAVMEGQATWLMWAYVSKLGGGEAKVSDMILESMSGSTPTSEQYPIFGKAPLYLRESMMFPYARGLQFQDAVIKKLGTAGFSEVFKNPPVSSEQILHPEAYFARHKPIQVAAPKPPDVKALKLVSAGSVGEFDYQMLLEQYLGETAAKDIGPHWRGGSYRLYESKKMAKAVLAHASEWDSESSARAFSEAFQEVLKKRNITNASVKLEGRKVSSIEVR